MTVYITFNVYDHSEFYLWDATTRKSTAIKNYKEKHLLDLYEGAQPDISRLVLATVDITKSKYNLFKKYLKFDEQSKELEREVEETLSSIYETEEYRTIFDEQGDFGIDAMRYHCEQNNIEIDEEYDIDDIIDKLEEYDDHKEDLVPIFVNYIEWYYCEGE